MMQPGVTPGAVFEFHAARCNGGVSPGVNSPLTTTAFDTSLNSNHGTLQTFAGTAASGYAGTGTPADPYRLVFDGASDYISCPDLGAGEDRTFTYETWFAVSALGANATLIGEGNTGDTLPTCGLLVYADQTLSFNCRLSTMVSAVAGSGLVDGEVHHAVGVSDGSTIRAYADNVAGAAASWAGDALPLNTTTVGMLARTSLSSYFPGAILLARIYPFALTPAQVAANYNAGYLWSDPRHCVIGSPVIRGLGAR